ncbi:unnamed protein product, partial [Owenia fusiformis]
GHWDTCNANSPLCLTEFKYSNSKGYAEISKFCKNDPACTNLHNLSPAACANGEVNKGQSCSYCCYTPACNWGIPIQFHSQYTGLAEFATAPTPPFHVENLDYETSDSTSSTMAAPTTTMTVAPTTTTAAPTTTVAAPTTTMAAVPTTTTAALTTTTAAPTTTTAALTTTRLAATTMAAPETTKTAAPTTTTT